MSSLAMVLSVALLKHSSALMYCLIGVARRDPQGSYFFVQGPGFWLSGRLSFDCRSLHTRIQSSTLDIFHRVFAHRT